MQKPIIVDAFIEIPAGSQNKYEFDKEQGVFRLDRVLFSPMHYPADYGYIPETLEQDGDPVDIMVLITNPTFPGCMIDARVVGVLSMEDDKGIDMKLLAVADKDPRYQQIQTIEDVAPHIRREIEYFFAVYKDLEGKKTTIHGWQGIDYAAEVIKRARAAYRPAAK